MTERKKYSKGETFVETLVALLIAVLALLMLPLSLVVSARINNRIATSEKLRTVEVRPEESGIYEEQIKETVGVEEAAEYSVEVGDESISGVTVYRDSADYIFFDYEPSASASDGSGEGPGGE